MPMNEQEWLAARKRGIGATDAAAIVGASPYRTRLQVYLDKLGLDETPETGAMRRGKRLEPVVAGMYEEAAQVALAPPAERLIVHPSEPWAFCSPDRIAADGRIVELKTAGFRQEARWGESGSDDVPDEYAVQVMWQMACMDIDVADLAVLFVESRDFDLGIYTIRRARDVEANLVEQCRAFWHDHVVARVEPAIDGSEAASRYLKAKFPVETTSEIVTATGEQATLLEQYRDARAAFKAIEKEKAELENRVKAAIGERLGIQHPAVGAVTWKRRKESCGTDWAAMAAAEIEAARLAQIVATKQYDVVTRAAARVLGAKFD